MKSRLLAACAAVALCATGLAAPAVHAQTAAAPAPSADEATPWP